MLVRAALAGLRAAAGRNPLDDYWYQPLSTTASSGVPISAETALGTSPVWACVRLLADPIATLPIHVYRRRADGGKDRATQHWLFGLLRNQPNLIQTAFTWKRVSMVHALLWGNAYSQIVRGGRGMVDQLIPLHPDGVTPQLLDNGTLVYRLKQKAGQPDRILLDDEVLQLVGLSLDGYHGLSLVQYARESIGLALATQGYTARFFSQNARPGGILKHPGKLSKDGKARLREEWQQLHAGLANSHKVAVLEEGMEWQSTGLTNQDAQLLGLIDWNIADLARWFNVPLHMIGETAKVTSWGSGIEQLSIGFVTYSLLPWLENWQQTIKKDLIFQDQTYFAEFETAALLRGNLKERYEAYAIAIDKRWMTPNEVRDRENMNPLDGGDQVVQPPAPAPAPASPNPDGMPMQDRQHGQDVPARDGRNAKLREFVHDAAARLVRKEIAAMGKLLKRAADRVDLAAQATAFYAEHADFVAEVLKLPPSAAHRYAEHQREDLLDNGAEALARWEQSSVETLITLALPPLEVAA